MSLHHVYLLDGMFAVIDLSHVQYHLHGVLISSMPIMGEDDDFSPVYSIDLLQGQDGRWVCCCMRNGKPFAPPPGSVRRAAGFTLPATGSFAGRW